MTIPLASPIGDLTLPEITAYIEQRFKFGQDHIVDLKKTDWQLEHPMRCRLLQYEPVTGQILPLRETCALNRAMEEGFAAYLFMRYGPTRLSLSPEAIYNIMQQYEEPPQPPALSLTITGEELKAQGQQAAMSAAELNEWKVQFYTAVAELAALDTPFTSEDVTYRIGLPRTTVQTNRNNAVGAMMSAAAKRGVIQKTGRRVKSKRPSSHAAELTQWIGAI